MAPPKKAENKKAEAEELAEATKEVILVLEDDQFDLSRVVLSLCLSHSRCRTFQC